jgi:hypothetical protein
MTFPMTGGPTMPPSKLVGRVSKILRSFFLMDQSDVPKKAFTNAHSNNEKISVIDYK